MVPRAQSLNTGAWLALLLFLAAACGDAGDGSGERVPSGQLDPAYGSSGKVALPAGAYYQNMLVDNEGNAFVAARMSDASLGYVVKLDPSGAVATSYGEAGRAIVSTEWTGAMTSDAGGNLYAATADLGVVGLDPLGHRIPDVGDNRVFALPVAVVRLADGTFYVAVTGGGFAGQTFGTLLRFDRNGRRVREQEGTSVAAGIPVVVADQARGALYVASTSRQTVRVALNKFDLATRAVTSMAAAFMPFCEPSFSLGGDRDVGMDIDRDGNIYMAATCAGGRATLWKLDPLGQLVGTFGNGGFRTAVLGPDSAASAPRVTFVRVGPDGSVYVAGASDQGGCYKLTIAKVDSQGRDVAAFGTGGRLVVDVPNSTATTIELDAHGRLYALGRANGTCVDTLSLPNSHFVVRTGA